MEAAVYGLDRLCAMGFNLTHTFPIGTLLKLGCARMHVGHVSRINMELTIKQDLLLHLTRQNMRRRLSSETNNY